jgi:hypothetical protein
MPREIIGHAPFEHMKPGDKIPFNLLSVGDIFEDEMRSLFIKTGMHSYRRQCDNFPEWIAHVPDADYIYRGVDLPTIIKNKVNERAT